MGQRNITGLLSATGVCMHTRNTCTSRPLLNIWTTETLAFLVVPTCSLLVILILLSLDKCEWSFICLAMSYEEGDEEADMQAKAEECVKVAHKHIDEDGISLPDVGMACAQEYPTLEGSPFPHE